MLRCNVGLLGGTQPAAAQRQLGGAPEEALVGSKGRTRVRTRVRVRVRVRVRARVRVGVRVRARAREACVT